MLFLLMTLKGYSGPLSPLVGKGNMKSGQLINAPFDFSRFNYIPLSNLHDLMQKIIFPDTVSKKAKPYTLRL
jgi:hypothetical protein